ncbi:hypothetical protein NQZ68_026050 [Dissostichus eleginoides]|nr:hypothetical protein NQZ68_026050 [Dissostichus eleginoides]
MSRRGEEGKRVIRGRQGNQEGDEKCSVLVVDEDEEGKKEETEEMGIDGEREGAEEQSPGSMHRECGDKLTNTDYKGIAVARR